MHDPNLQLDTVESLSTISRHEVVTGIAEDVQLFYVRCPTFSHIMAKSALDSPIAITNDSYIQPRTNHPWPPLMPASYAAHLHQPTTSLDDSGLAFLIPADAVRDVCGHSGQ